MLPRNGRIKSSIQRSSILKKKRVKQMLHLEQEEEEEMMEKATNNESQQVVQGTKMFTKATSVNRTYSEEERQLLNSYDSMDYLPPHSQVSSHLYKEKKLTKT